MPTVSYRFAHGWRLEDRAGVEPRVIRQFLRPAVRAVPASLAARLGPCRIVLVASLETEDVRSRWTLGAAGLEVLLAASDVEPHELTLELLLCLGQALWEAAPEERAGWLHLLDRELSAGVPGEIDDEVFERKKILLSCPAAARSLRETERYAAAAFAATVAEYVHALWHDVTVRQGPEHLPATALRRRLEHLERRYPPNRGYRLFPRHASLARP
ncbi:MAG: hypothetical protein RMK57_02855 [Bryobacterales bacterium]|nr:hypothetical protein [Bryobacteraceae bacterium]MDW8353448.1 hypothetical protein [Bryobacterales bacterium]